MKISIKEVISNSDLRKFVMFPSTLYKDNQYYVPSLISSELATLSDAKNPAFEFCEAKYWLAYDENNAIVGRIAGIINHKYNQKVGKRHVRFGWLDFVEDENVLKALLETVEAWAKAKYAEYIHGPLGFSSFDASGILIEGFNEIPTSFAHYNFPYYSQLIEKLGYKKEAEWIEYNVKVPAKLPERFLKGAALIKNRYGLQSAVVRKKKDLLKYSDEVFNLLNREYEELYAFTELTKLQVETLKEQFIPLLNLEYTSIILNREGEVIAFGIAIPSLSKALQKSRGKLFPFGFLYINRALHKNDTVDLLLIAIRKDFRRKGVNGIITNEIMYMLIRNGIKNVETTRELQNNLNISNLWGKLENRQHKKSLCYVKQL